MKTVRDAFEVQCPEEGGSAWILCESGKNQRLG